MLCVQRSKHEQLGNDRTLVTVRVLPPEGVMTGIWQLYWAIKRENTLGQFHSVTSMDPINNQSHLNLDIDRELAFYPFAVRTILTRDI